MEKKYAIILGTRPEIIKLSPIIRFCERNKLDYFIIHTNQHYSKELDGIFFDELNLKKSKYNLNIGSCSHGKQVGLMIEQIERILIKEQPSHVFVQGDTNSVLSGAIAASKLDVKIVHIEAGLRSYDRKMPEEINRILVDSITDVYQCPTENQRKILLRENVDEKKIVVCGNTISDAVSENKILAKQKSSILKNIDFKNKEYFLLTIHRPSNVDNKECLEEIFDSLKEISTQSNIKFIFPIHTRTKKNIENFNVQVPENIYIIDPVGYLDMLNLIVDSKLVFTDSGGIQEESCILQVPSLTLRDTTERPETLEVGASILVGHNKYKILESFNAIINNNSNNNWANPFGKNVTQKLFDFLNR